MAHGSWMKLASPDQSRRMALSKLVGVAVAAVSVAWPSGVAAQTPISASRFGISIDGVQVASFSEAVMTTEVVVDTSSGTRILRTQGKATFRRPQTANLWVWSTYEAMLQQRGVQRQNMIVTAYDPTNKPVARYYLENAWPQRVGVSGLAGAADVGIEEFTWVVELMRRIE